MYLMVLELGCSEIKKLVSVKTMVNLILSGKITKVSRYNETESQFLPFDIFLVIIILVSLLSIFADFEIFREDNMSIKSTTTQTITV